MPWNRFEPLRKGVLREDGYIAPSYVIDAHAHIHLHIPRVGKTGFKNFYEVSEQILSREKAGFIDPKSLIREMDRYGVDKACILCADGMYIDFDQYLNILKTEPDRFIGFFWPQWEINKMNTEKPPITLEGMAEQVEKALSHPEIKGLGEGLIIEACLFGERKGWPADDILRFYMPMLEAVESRKVPMFMHSGPDPYKVLLPPGARKFYRGYGGHWNVDPMVYDEMATLDLIEKAIANPGIGAEKLIMGSDFGATSSWYVYKGQVLPSYKKEPFPELPGMHIEQAIRVLEQVTMTPEERRLIMGQNMARLLGLD